MNKKLFGFMVGSLALVLAAQASALTVGAATGINVGVTTTVGAQTAASSSATSSMGLQMEVQAGTVNASSDDVVSLQGNSVNMIQSSGDLSAYNNLVVKARPAVHAVNVNSDNSIDIAYSQPAKFLGLFSTSLSGDVNVNASGTTTVHLPWYAFLYSKNTAGVQASVANAVQASGAASLSADANASAAARMQDQARIVNAATAAIQSDLQTTASANANANVTSSASGY